MISRSHVATPARIVSISLLVGLRVSSLSPPIDRITRPTPRLVRSASMDSSSAVLRASRSGLVTVAGSAAFTTYGTSSATSCFRRGGRL
jgi:hypothetical protein